MFISCLASFPLISVILTFPIARRVSQEQISTIIVNHRRGASESYQKDLEISWLKKKKWFTARTPLGVIVSICALRNRGAGGGRWLGDCFYPHVVIGRGEMPITRWGLSAGVERGGERGLITGSLRHFRHNELHTVRVTIVLVTWWT